MSSYTPNPKLMKNEEFWEKRKEIEFVFGRKKKHFYKGDLIGNIFLWTYSLHTPKTNEL